MLDVVKNFEKVNGIKIPYEIVARRAGDVTMCYASPDKANSVLGWSAKYSLEDMWCKNSTLERGLFMI